MTDQCKYDLFADTLAHEYERLFVEDPGYSLAASRYSPDELARKITNGLASGKANKDGDGIKRACAALGVKWTYRAIRQFLGSGEPDSK